MSIIVAGIGTDVGKTVVSTILCLKYGMAYWKPIECGESDTNWVKQYVSPIYTPQYSFKAPLSPHAAAEKENKIIGNLDLPTKLPLVIEMAGGILTPVRKNLLSLDYFSQINARWVLVSQHYLGSINHTLLTWEALKSRGIRVKTIIFNGFPNAHTEEVILNFSQISHFERLENEVLNFSVLKKWAAKWKEI